MAQPREVSTPAIRFLVVAGAMLVGLAALGPAAGAHSGIQSYVYLSIRDSEVEGRVEFPANDLGEVLGIDFPSDPARAEEVAIDNAEAIRAYSAEHLAIADPDGEWELSFVEDPTILPAAGNYVLVPFAVERSFDGPPRTFQVDYDGIIHANPERDALFLIENDWGTARFNNEGDHLLGFSVGMTSQAIELEDVGTLESMGAVRGLGTDVVRDGVDHILFVVALLLPAALATPLGGARGPAPTIAGALRRTAVLLGIFIASSSVVLWILGLAAADWSADVVGALVAASLLVTAAYAFRRFTSREWIVVVVVGAVQGIGFARGYVDSQLDLIDRPLALLAFNIGIVVAVLTIAALVVPILLLMRRSALAAVALPGIALAICAYAMAWLVERITGTDLPIERVATPLSVWPRNLGLLLLGWVLAAALHAWTAQRDTLRPVEGDDRHHDADRSMVTS